MTDPYHSEDNDWFEKRIFFTLKMAIPAIVIGSVIVAPWGHGAIPIGIGISVGIILASQLIAWRLPPRQK